MINKLFIYVFISLFLIACGVKNEDGSDPTTYSSCSIIDSGALFAGDRAKDISQCWDGVSYKDKDTALSWCNKKVSNYIGKEYIFGHSVILQVVSTNCPK